MNSSIRRYSLNRRILLFYLLPLVFLLAILFLYLNVYRSNVETLAETTFHSLVDLKQQQVEENLDEIRSITKEIAYSSLLQQYLLETNQSEKVQTYAHFQNYLRAISTNSSSIVSAYASLGNWSSVHMADGFLFTFEEAKNELKLAGVLDKNSEYFTGLSRLTTAMPNHLYGMYFYVGSTLRSGSNNHDNQTVGAVIYDPSKLLEFGPEDSGHIAVLMVREQVVFLSGEPDAALLSQVLSAKKPQVTHNSVDYYHHESLLSNNPEMKFIYLVPGDTLIKNSNFWEHQALAFILFGAILMSLSVILIINAIFMPIRQLCKEVESLGSYGDTLSTPRARELNVLTDTFNAMSKRISASIRQEKEMLDQQYQLHIQKNRMEMQAFRNQINPHFLFNTLECLNGMVRYYKLEPVSELIANLSACFHYSLYSGMMVRLSEELDHLNSYLEIISTRFPGKYRIIRQVDPEVESIPVPSLLLQPLAENAVTHAFQGHTKKARPTIVLQARLDGTKEHLLIHIIDNGMGMDDEKLSEVLETMHSAEYVDKHISLNNVFRRLTLLYGQNCMQIRSKSGRYTKISVTIPVSSDAEPPPPDGTHSA